MAQNEKPRSGGTLTGLGDFSSNSGADVTRIHLIKQPIAARRLGQRYGLSPWAARMIAELAFGTEAAHG
ncbi:hypothetical protein [Nitrospirillum viridazoti]|uniref:hypothetical protein n=1 Tax=Nitrospirillum viridazoti TaxID=3144925 RepID=UPI0005948F06|nr:hypothetical protein [Nitrospirillum amazonense]